METRRHWLLIAHYLFAVMRGPLAGFGCSVLIVGIVAVGIALIGFPTLAGVGFLLVVGLSLLNIARQARYFWPFVVEAVHDAESYEMSASTYSEHARDEESP